MAPTEKSSMRKAAPAPEADSLEADVEAVIEAAVTPSPAEAIHELRDSVGRAWSEARDSVSGLGVKLGQRARNVRDETRQAASDTRESFDDAVSEMGELGEEIAEDAMELGRSIGVSVSQFVRRHPVRSVAIAAVAGALAAHLLRRRR
ncbi:hypothetical protein DFR29_11259 [Tahibacter aquaticus]|uniref:ElaB/YqjD/DUF883 family membrane-anchored ribosome-binding protein n=1 Tax=Tahibacter aquaticus TaxID=520092 RepID=A0A4R6YRK7_9GAMM|nr:hypothetical protein [Tahibacter aquaticus]TDR40745.1 hypothetical protein DFR29_11259 [Tahibacter aquaticus]